MSESNNNVPIPITQLQEATAYEEGMYYAVAKAGMGTKKISTKIIDKKISTITNILELTPDITNDNVFIYDTDNKIYPNTGNGFTLNAYKIKAGNKYSCVGESISGFDFGYSVVFYGLIYTDTAISLNEGTTLNFDDKNSIAAHNNFSNYEEFIEATNDGYIILLTVNNKFTNTAISQDLTAIQDSLENLNERVTDLESFAKLEKILTNDNVFIYDTDNKIYPDTNIAFKLSAYRIKAGNKYICVGTDLQAFNTFRYGLVYMGVVYSDGIINLNSGTTLSFDYKISYAANTTPSNYKREFTAENDGYIVLLTIDNIYDAYVLGQNLYDDYEIKKELQTVATMQKRNIENTLFNASFVSGEFTEMNDWSISSGKVTTSTYGLTNVLKVNKSFAVEERKTYIKIKTSDSNAKIAVGYISPAYEYGSSMFYVDFANNKIAICEAFANLSTIPNDRVSKTLEMSLVTNRDYLLILTKEKKKNTFTIINSLTGKSESIETESLSTNNLNNEFAGGRQNGFPFACLLNGNNAEISDWYITTPFFKPYIAIYGDSITEGDRLNNFQKRFADYLKEQFGNLNVSVSGMSGSNLQTATKQIQDEISIIKPDVVIIGIGTNGSMTEQALNDLKDYIENQNIRVFFDHVPMLPNSGASSINAKIDLIDTKHAFMDISTAINNNISDGQNANLFADLIHPNEAGHKAMFERFVIDLPIYHK